MVMMLLLLHASQHPVPFGDPSSALVQYLHAMNARRVHAAFILIVHF